MTTARSALDLAYAIYPVDGADTGNAILTSDDEPSSEIDDVRCIPAGSYVVKLDQPYRNYAVDLLTPQHFPKDGGQPYDDISWELPAHYRLEAKPTNDRAVRLTPLTPLTERPDVKGSVSGSEKP